MTHALLLVLVLVTATVSGVFGMAGGLMLMGGLTLAMPVAAAMVTHGAVQFVSRMMPCRMLFIRSAEGSFKGCSNRNDQV